VRLSRPSEGRQSRWIATASGASCRPSSSASAAMTANSAARGPLPREAMKTFTNRVNAMLPTDQPDSILLALVRAQHDTVCGKPCPTGQGLGDSGQCLPYAILAKSADGPAKRPTPTITGWTSSASTTLLPPAVAVLSESPVALGVPTGPASVAPAPQATARPAEERRERPQAKQKANWAANLFKQQERLGLN
jgi:hypothetical protein